MGDARFEQAYEQVRSASDRARAIYALDDDQVVQALAAAARHRDPLLANVLATEAMNRMRRSRTAMMHLAEGVLACDAEGRVTSLNPAAERLLGYTREEILGRDVHEAILSRDEHGSPRPREGCPMLDVMRTREPVARDDDVYVRKDGSWFHVSYTAAPIVRDGEVHGFVSAFRDVTERRRGEERLRESEQRHRAVFESVQDGIMVATRERGVVDCNRALEAMTGYARDELLGRATSVLYEDPRDFEEMGRALLEALAEGPAGGAVRCTFRWRRKDGSVFLADVTASVLLDAEGRVAGYIGSVRDAGALAAREEEHRRLLREAREAREKLHALFVQAPVAIAMVDGPGHVFSFVNARYERLVGMDASALVGRPAAEAIPQLVEQGFIRLLDGVRATGEAFHAEGAPVTLPSPEGPRRTYHNFVYQPVRGPDGRVDSILGIAVDVTAQVEAQNATRALAEALEARVRERTRELSDANRDLQRANDVLESFAYAVSHDLKEPVRAVEAFLQAAREETDAAERDGLLRRALDANRRQHALIQGLLSYSRASLAPVELAPVDLDEAVAEALGTYCEQAAREAGAVVSVEPLPRVMGDALLLGQLFGNLALNAIRHNPRAGKRVRVHAQARSDGFVEVMVDDNGPGFPADVRRAMGSAEGGRPSTLKRGFGLAISQRAAERLGGRLLLDASPEGGGRVRVLLRAA